MSKGKKILFLFTISLLLSSCCEDKSQWVHLRDGRFVNLNAISTITIKGFVALKNKENLFDTNKTSAYSDTILYDSKNRFITPEWAPIPLDCKNPLIHSRDSIIGTLTVYFDTVEYIYFNYRDVASEENCTDIRVESLSLGEDLVEILKPQSFFETISSIFKNKDLLYLNPFL